MRITRVETVKRLRALKPDEPMVPQLPLRGSDSCPINHLFPGVSVQSGDYLPATGEARVTCPAWLRELVNCIDSGLGEDGFIPWCEYTPRQLLHMLR